MADTADVEHALVSLVAQALYPNGTGSPSALAAPVRVSRGWPLPAQLDAALAAGHLTVSVYPTDTESRVTRHQPRWVDLPVPPPTLTLTAAADTVTVSGTPASPLNAAVLADGTAYVYAVQPGDTPPGIAAGLAALIAAGRPATSSGPVLTVPGVHRLAARAGGVGTSVRERRRQRRGYQVTLWCPTPEARDALAAVVDAALAAVEYLSLPDGTAARLLYDRTRLTDAPGRDGLYRRDLLYSAEFSATESRAAAQIVAELQTLTHP